VSAGAADAEAAAEAITGADDATAGADAVADVPVGVPDSVLVQAASKARTAAETTMRARRCMAGQLTKSAFDQPPGLAVSE
jgi:hypothetical protein